MGEVRIPLPFAKLKDGVPRRGWYTFGEKGKGPDPAAHLGLIEVVYKWAHNPARVPPKVPELELGDEEALVPSAEEVAGMVGVDGDEMEKQGGFNELLVCLVQARGLAVMDRAMMYVSRYARACMRLHVCARLPHFP